MGKYTSGVSHFQFAAAGFFVSVRRVVFSTLVISNALSGTIFVKTDFQTSALSKLRFSFLSRCSLILQIHLTQTRILVNSKRNENEEVVIFSIYLAHIAIIFKKY